MYASFVTILAAVVCAHVGVANVLDPSHGGTYTHVNPTEVETMKQDSTAAIRSLGTDAGAIYDTLKTQMAGTPTAQDFLTFSSNLKSIVANLLPKFQETDNIAKRILHVGMTGGAGHCLFLNGYNAAGGDLADFQSRMTSQAACLLADQAQAEAEVNAISSASSDSAVYTAVGKVLMTFFRSADGMGQVYDTCQAIANSGTL